MIKAVIEAALQGPVVQKPYLDQNDLDLEIPCLAIQDQVIRLSFLIVFQSKIRLEYKDPDTRFQITKSGLVNYRAPKRTW